MMLGEFVRVPEPEHRISAGRTIFSVPGDRIAVSISPGGDRMTRIGPTPGSEIAFRQRLPMAGL